MWVRLPRQLLWWAGRPRYGNPRRIRACRIEPLTLQSPHHYWRWPCLLCIYKVARLNTSSAFMSHVTGEKPFLYSSPSPLRSIAAKPGKMRAISAATVKRWSSTGERESHCRSPGQLTNGNLKAHCLKLCVFVTGLLFPCR